LQDAVQELSKSQFNLIITDLFLPDSSGIETFLRIHQITETTPIVIISGLNDEELALEAVSRGAQDYVPKNEVNAHILSRVVRYALERNVLQESLRAQSFTDELTKLYNRRGFLTLTEQHINLSLRLKQGFHLFYIDLDHLKEINDTYGHLQGDEAIRQAAQCLRDSFRNSDIIGRIGGDEFAVLAVNTGENQGVILKKHLNDTLTNYNSKKNHPYAISLSIGIAYFDPEKDLSIDHLLERADRELYQSKRAKSEARKNNAEIELD
jgi:two-component system cell cycle response regulator